MVWAIDLDDGTLIDSLGESLGRQKTLTLPELPLTETCFGGGECAPGWCDAITEL
jgi:chitinase